MGVEFAISQDTKDVMIIGMYILEMKRSKFLGFVGLCHGQCYPNENHEYQCNYEGHLHCLVYPLQFPFLRIFLYPISSLPLLIF